MASLSREIVTSTGLARKAVLKRASLSRSLASLSSQFLLGSLAYSDVDADGLKELPATELDRRQKDFDRNSSSVPVQDDPFESRTAVAERVGDVLSFQRFGALAAGLDRGGDFGRAFADHLLQAGIAHEL